MSEIHVCGAYCEEKLHLRFSSSLVLFFFYKVRGKEKVQIEEAEDEIFGLLVRTMGQAPKTPDPTFPIRQLDSIVD